MKVPFSRIPFAFLFLVLPWLLLTGCEDAEDDSGHLSLDDPTPKDTITILYTNDEHGWMEREGTLGGAAEMYDLWRTREKMTTPDGYLVLSGGDMWTGPAISTWFSGESMVEVMNAMVYDATTLGNHEFDFGLDTLALRAQQMNFPIVAANVTETATGDSPDYLQPYVICIEGLRVIGVVGLANRYTVELNFPFNVEGLTVGDYESALREYVPLAFNDGAEAVVVIAHISGSELRALAPVAAELGVSLVGGGHTNEYIAEVNSGTNLIMANYNLRYYGRMQLIFEDDGSVTTTVPELVENGQSGSNTTVAGIVSSWQQQLNIVLGTVIGYASEEIPRYSHELSNLMLDGWLEQSLGGRVAFTNVGGFRASIPAGNITLATIVGVLPFDNEIIRMPISGSNLVAFMNEQGTSIRYGGITSIGGYQFLDGNPIAADSTYQMLITDYYYFATSSSNVNLTQLEPNPYYTGWNFRDPLIAKIQQLNTSSDDPLNNYLDSTPRQ